MMVHEHDTVYEIVSTSVDNQIAAPGTASCGETPPWVCSQSQHRIMSSTNGQSMLIWPRSSFIHVSVQLWHRRISKKKREIKDCVRECECLAESHVSIQQLLDMIHVSEDRLHSIVLVDLAMENADSQTIELSAVEHALASLHGSRIVKLVITATA